MTPISKSQPATSLLVKDNLEELNYRGQIGDTDKTSKHYRRPPDLDPSIELYQYQKEGLMWLESIDTYEPGTRTHSWDGGLLADDMGLGKTLQVLSHLNNLTRRGRCGPHLIVAPVALLENWRMEARKFFGHAFEPTLLVQGTSRNQSMHSQLATIKKSQNRTGELRDTAQAGVPICCS